ncbi:MAG: hypothetical protein SNJ52_03940, partial [Verrucomicrobiia bacterium]
MRTSRLTISFFPFLGSLFVGLLQAGSPELVTNLDQLNKANIDRALSVLKKSAAGQAILTEDELARATLAGLLARHPALARVREPISPSDKEELPSLIHAFDGVLYWRPGNLSPSNRETFERDRDRVEHSGESTIILDLRAAKAKQDPDMVLEVVSLFVPQGEEVFRLVGFEAKDSRVFISNNEDALLQERLLVLVDADLAGAPEAAAAVL